SGVGRKSGGTQRKWLASHHRANKTSIVATLIAVLEPSPGAANRDVFGRFAPSSGSAALLTAGLRARRPRALLDDGQNLLSHGDEIRRRLDRPGIAGRHEAASEVDSIFMCDPTRPR